jgi:hypothetical protein
MDPPNTIHLLKMKNFGKKNQAWWCMSIIPALGRLKQNCEFKTSLGYIERPVSQKQPTNQSKMKCKFFLPPSFLLSFLPFLS